MLLWTTWSILFHSSVRFIRLQSEISPHRPGFYHLILSFRLKRTIWRAGICCGSTMFFAMWRIQHVSHRRHPILFAAVFTSMVFVTISIYLFKRSWTMYNGIDRKLIHKIFEKGISWPRIIFANPLTFIIKHLSKWKKVSCLVFLGEGVEPFCLKS